MSGWIDLPPAGRLAGSMTLPGSKSITNRVLLLAALADGETMLEGVLDSDDASVMRDALGALGVPLKSIGGATWKVSGQGGVPGREASLFVGNSGLSIRTLVAALAFAGGTYRLHGVPRMHERPIGDLVDALLPMGASIRYEGQPGFPPLIIEPPRAGRREARVRGDVSSQFLTGLLQAAPLAATESDVIIEVDGALISRPYVEITLNLMQRFGVTVEREGWTRFLVRQGSRYRSPGLFRVEGDASSASYFLAAGILGGGPLTVQGIGRDSIQGDARFADVLERMGGQIDWQSDAVVASRAHRGKLRSIDFDANAIPDAAMTLAVLALFAEGSSVLRNIGSWRVKETDRLSAMARELRKVGAVAEEGSDWLRITPPSVCLSPPGGIDTYDDHRIAMCFSLVTLAGIPLRINEPGCVAKTFPDYFDVFHSLVRT